MDLNSLTDTERNSNILSSSIRYSPPEIFQAGEHDLLKVDVWGLGVLLFYMLNGFFPFDGDWNAALIQSILHHDMIPNQYASPEALDLIMKMLETDPSMRISIASVADHPWAMKGHRLSATKEDAGSGYLLQYKKAVLDQLQILEEKPSISSDDSSLLSIVVDIELSAYHSDSVTKERKDLSDSSTHIMYDTLVNSHSKKVEFDSPPSQNFKVSWIHKIFHKPKVK
jgi:serine/threonine protein kinase